MFNLDLRCFSGKLGPKNWSSPNWLKFGTGKHSYILFSILLFIYSKIFAIHIFLGKFGPKIWSSPNWSEFGTGIYCYMLVTILMVIFSKFLSFIFFGKIWSQNLTFSKLTEVWDKCTFLYLINPNLRDLFRGFVWGGGRGVG